jgi:DMSO/TMAO reductase YedYZ molybdopterin-dependent catalytic subunit
MQESSPLPPGQVEVDDFPRFGLATFAFRFPTETERIEIAVDGDVEHPTRFVAADLEPLERVEQVSDLHCVTTWTRRGLQWGGWRFRDFYEQLVEPRVRPETRATLVVLRAQDGLAQSLPLEDALAPDVLLADHLDGERLCVAHGAPIRFGAPAHYGCKSVRPPERGRVLARRAELSLSWPASPHEPPPRTRDARGARPRVPALGLPEALAGDDPARAPALRRGPATPPAARVVGRPWRGAALAPPG